MLPSIHPLTFVIFLLCVLKVRIYFSEIDCENLDNRFREMSLGILPLNSYWPQAAGYSIPYCCNLNHHLKSSPTHQLKRNPLFFALGKLKMNGCHCWWCQVRIYVRLKRTT
jgi:hypothetical protein